jgi:hypothetical protein
MSKLDRYIITKGPNGRVWWGPGETLPDKGYTYIRDALPDEVALAKRIQKHAMPPLSLGEKICKLMARDVPTLAPITECSPTHEISHATAEKLRQMLADVQEQCISVAPTSASELLVQFISARGFRLIDDMEGVIR